MTIFNKVRSTPIFKSSVFILLITIAAKIIGYAEKIILAYYYGTSYVVDIYNVVITIVISIFIFFREIIEPGFLNNFLTAKNSNDDRHGWGLFYYFSKYIIIITLTLSAFVFFWPSATVHLFAPGFTPEKSRLLMRLIQIAFPACIFLSLSALTSITLNGLKKFALPASGDLAFKIIILLTFVILHKYFGIYAIAVGVLAGAAAKLFLHVVGLFKYLAVNKISTKTTYLGDTWKLTWPLLIGMSLSLVSSLIDNVFASYLQEGSISALSYSKKIIELPILLFPYILSVVVFPYLTELSITKQKEKLRNLLSQTLSWITLIFVPLSVFCFMFPHEIVEIVFKRGAFNEQSIALTALPLRFYSIGLVFFAIETILVIFYFANANTKTPVFIGALCVMINIALISIFIKFIGYAGIALALVISKAAKVFVLLWLLEKHIAINYNAVFSFLYKLVLACVAFTMALLISEAIFENVFRSTLIGKLLYLFFAFSFASLVYIITLRVLNFNKGLLVKKA